MSDIFISYAREDLEAARRLAAALEDQGWSVFWDRTIPAGKSWREVIGAALADARCIVVLWSPHSTGSNWVIEEADHGLRRRVLIPAFIERIEPPLGFGSIQAADLSEWGGDRQTAAIQRFFNDVAGILGPAPVIRGEQRREAEVETKRKAAEQRRQQAEAEARRKAEEQRQQAEADTKRKAEEQRQQAEADAKRKAEEQRQQAEADAKRKAEEQRQQAEARGRAKEPERQRANADAWNQPLARRRAEEAQLQLAGTDAQIEPERKTATWQDHLKLAVIAAVAFSALYYFLRFLG